MHLGNQTLDPEILTNIFGVNDYSQLKQNLSIDGDAIVYKADVKNDSPPPEFIKQNIPIAKMTNRPDGIGYGDSWKLEFSLHDDFKKSIKKVNKDLGRN